MNTGFPGCHLSTPLSETSRYPDSRLAGSAFCFPSHLRLVTCHGADTVSLLEVTVSAHFSSAVGGLVQPQNPLQSGKSNPQGRQGLGVGRRRRLESPPQNSLAFSSAWLGDIACRSATLTEDVPLWSPQTRALRGSVRPLGASFLRTRRLGDRRGPH